MKFLSVDLLAGLAALLWALVALYQAPIASLCSAEVAFTFALAALTRGVVHTRAALAQSTEE